MRQLVSSDQYTEVHPSNEDMKILAEDSRNKLSSYFDIWKRLGAACLVSSNPFKNKQLSDYISSHEMETLPVGPMVFDKCYSQIVYRNWGMIIICIDDFEGISPIFSKVRHLRDVRSNVPILLTSFAFKSHDLTEERLAVCDASIRFPLDEASLPEIFVAAWENNHKWRTRVSELHFCGSGEDNNYLSRSGESLGSE